jgi:hypothetical protein
LVEIRSVNFLRRLAANHDLPDLYLLVARVTGAQLKFVSLKCE